MCLRAAVSFEGDPAEESELATALRSLAIKTRTVGHMHRSLVPTLTKLTALFREVGDIPNLRVTMEQRLRIVEAEAAKEREAAAGIPDQLDTLSSVLHTSPGSWTRQACTCHTPCCSFTYSACIF